jgi:hypothetical protein
MEFACGAADWAAPPGTAAAWGATCDGAPAGGVDWLYVDLSGLAAAVATTDAGQPADERARTPARRARRASAPALMRCAAPLPPAPAALTLLGEPSPKAAAPPLEAPAPPHDAPAAGAADRRRGPRARGARLRKRGSAARTPSPAARARRQGRASDTAPTVAAGGRDVLMA